MIYIDHVVHNPHEPRFKRHTEATRRAILIAPGHDSLTNCADGVPVPGIIVINPSSEDVSISPYKSLLFCECKKVAGVVPSVVRIGPPFKSSENCLKFVSYAHWQSRVHKYRPLEALIILGEQ